MNQPLEFVKGVIFGDYKLGNSINSLARILGYDQFLKQAKIMDEDSNEPLEILIHCLGVLFEKPNMYLTNESAASKLPFDEETLRKFFSHPRKEWIDFASLLSLDTYNNYLARKRGNKPNEESVLCLDEMDFESRDWMEVHYGTKKQSLFATPYFREHKIITATYYEGGSCFPVSAAVVPIGDDHEDFKAITGLISSAVDAGYPVRTVVLKYWNGNDTMIEWLEDRGINMVGRLREDCDVDFRYKGEKEKGDFTYQEIFMKLKPNSTSHRSNGTVLCSCDVKTIPAGGEGESFDLKMIFLKDDRGEDQCTCLVTTDAYNTNRGIKKLYNFLRKSTIVMDDALTSINKFLDEDGEFSEESLTALLTLSLTASFLREYYRSYAEENHTTLNSVIESNQQWDEKIPDFESYLTKVRKKIKRLLAREDMSLEELKEMWTPDVSEKNPELNLMTKLPAWAFVEADPEEAAKIWENL